MAIFDVSLIISDNLYFSAMIISSATSANLVEKKKFHLEAVSSCAWSQISKTSVFAPDGLVQCGKICLKKGDSCNIFHHDKNDNMCTFGKVLMENDPKRYNSSLTNRLNRHF